MDRGRRCLAPIAGQEESSLGSEIGIDPVTAIRALEPLGLLPEHLREGVLRFVMAVRCSAPDGLRGDRRELAKFVVRAAVQGRFTVRRRVDDVRLKAGVT